MVENTIALSLESARGGAIHNVFREKFRNRRRVGAERHPRRRQRSAQQAARDWAEVHQGLAHDRADGFAVESVTGTAPPARQRIGYTHRRDEYGTGRHRCGRRHLL